jgi:hypothetical protein
VRCSLWNNLRLVWLLVWWIQFGLLCIDSMAEKVIAKRNSAGDSVLVSNGNVWSSMVDDIPCGHYDSVMIMNDVFSACGMPEMLVQLYKRAEFEFALLTLDAIIRSIFENEVDIMQPSYSQALNCMTRDLLDADLNIEYYMEFRGIVSLTWNRLVAQRQVLLKPNVKYGEQVLSINFFAVETYRSSIVHAISEYILRIQFKHHLEVAKNSISSRPEENPSTVDAMLVFILLCEQLAKEPSEWILIKHINCLMDISQDDKVQLSQLGVDMQRFIHNTLSEMDINKLAVGKDRRRGVNCFELTSVDMFILTTNSLSCLRLRSFLWYMMLEERSYSIALTKKNAKTQSVQTFDSSLKRRIERHAEYSRASENAYYFTYKLQ